MKSGLDNKWTWIDYCNLVFIFVMASFLIIFFCFFAAHGADGIIDEINHHMWMDLE